MTDHPITPPPELVQQWLTEGRHQDYCNYIEHAITKAARWGADQELEACCKYMQHEDFHGFATELRAARRLKPPSLKEQALSALYAIATGACDTREFHQDLETIKEALDSLPS